MSLEIIETHDITPLDDYISPTFFPEEIENEIRNTPIPKNLETDRIHLLSVSYDYCTKSGGGRGSYSPILHLYSWQVIDQTTCSEDTLSHLIKSVRYCVKDILLGIERDHNAEEISKISFNLRLISNSGIQHSWIKYTFDQSAEKAIPLLEG